MGLRLGDSYNPPLGDSIPYWTAIELQRERERRREGQKLGTAKKLRQRSFLLVVHTAWFAQRGSIVLEGMKKRERERLFTLVPFGGWVEMYPDSVTQIASGCEGDPSRKRRRCWLFEIELDEGGEQEQRDGMRSLILLLSFFFSFYLMSVGSVENL